MVPCTHGIACAVRPLHYPWCTASDWPQKNHVLIRATGVSGRQQLVRQGWLTEGEDLDLWIVYMAIGQSFGNLVALDARAEQIVQEFVKAGSAVFEVALKDDKTPGLSTMAIDKKAISLSHKKLNILKEDLKTSQPKFIIESTDHTGFVLEAMGKDTAVQLADSRLRDIAVLVARIFTHQSLTTKKRGTLFPRRRKADSVLIHLQ